TMASILRSDLMALRLNFSASSRRSSSVRTSRTWSGTEEGFARRAMASWAAAAGSRTLDVPRLISESSRSAGGSLPDLRQGLRCLFAMPGGEYSNGAPDARGDRQADASGNGEPIALLSYKSVGGRIRQRARHDRLRS